MTYQPNFQDPRIQRTASRALAWSRSYVKPNQDQWLSCREIQRHFGSLSRPLGRYLRDQLLIVQDSYFNIQTGRCKTYRLNSKGWQTLAAQVGYQTEVKVTARTIEELTSGTFAYASINHREYNPLQNFTKQVKRPLLAQHGYRNEYDIQCAAQTLVLQYARQLGFDQPTPCLDQYIQNRSQVRKNLSEQLGLDTETIKRILTAILNGASISQWHTNTIFGYVNYNRLMIEHLRGNAWIQGYQQEVRSMWLEIRRHRDIPKGVRFNPKMKSEIYRFLEDSVRFHVKKFLKKHKHRAFIEHDGWTSDTAIDIDRLCEEVRRQTGFVIRLDWTVYEYDDCY